MNETLLPVGAVHEFLGIKTPERMRLTAASAVNKLNITDSPNPLVQGKWFRAEDVVRFLRLHARQEEDPFLDEIADQLRDHAGLSRSI